MAVVNQVTLSEATANNRFSAEFFDPRYVFSPIETSTWVPIGRILRKCEYGLSVPMNTQGKGFPMFRMNEIDNCFALRPEKYANIPKTLFNVYRLNENDVLFNRTNSFEFVGRTGIVKDQTDCTFASYLIRLIPNTDYILPEFLTVYLNTAFGIGQIKRRAMRSINQANVSGSEVRKILIPLIDRSVQEDIADLVNNAFIKKKESEERYIKAQHLLESELGLDKLNFKKPVGLVAMLSDLENSQRSDAQHFQPQYTQLLSHLLVFFTYKIRELRTYNRRGIQPTYIENGTIDVVNSQHLGPKHIDYEGLQKTSPLDYYAATEAQIRPNDILIYSTGAYVGRTNVYLSERPALASNHVNILRLREGIDAAYMSLVFQSIIGQYQTHKHVRGSAQAELYPADIDRFVVPLLEQEKQNEIGNLVRESLAKLQESKSLLECAKTRVEQLIEEAVKI